jgi:hypothetical protein
LGCLRSIGRLFGFILGGSAFGVLIAEVSNRVFSVWPFVVLAVAFVLIWMGRDSKTMPRGLRSANERMRSYFDAAPTAKRLWRWSNWLSWFSMPLIFAWVLLAISRFPELGVGWIVLGAFVFPLPGAVLSYIALRGYVPWARARIAAQKVGDE